MTDAGRLRVGLVGAGGISHLHLPYLLSLGADVLVYSLAGAEDLVAAYGGTAVASLDELLDGVDIVDVATPTYAHYSVARQAVLAGKHVICEKPLTRTAEQADELLELAEHGGRRVLPAHVVRYFPAYARLAEAVRSGRLGDLAVLRFFRSGAFPARTAWFANAELSGGIILDQMIHDLDIARWLAGEVCTVSATWIQRHGADSPAEAAHVLLTHESGAISQVSGLWGPAHLRFTTGYFAAGTGGTLEHNSADERGYTTDLARASGGESVPQTDPAQDPYFLVLKDLLTAISQATQPRTTGADGAAAVRIGNAALESARSGRPVRLQEEGGTSS